MKRTVEFVLALLGGIFGVFGAFFAFAVGGLGSVLHSQGSAGVSHLGWSALIISIIAIIFSVVLKNPSKTKLSGIILIICAIGGVISISMFYILPGILILISGIMCLVKKMPN